MATYKRSSEKRSPPRQNAHSQEDEDSGNKFANDGSFMELFRKKMEEERKKNKESDGKSRTSGSSTTESRELTSDTRKAPSNEPEKNTPKPYQVVVLNHILGLFPFKFYFPCFRGFP